MENASEALGGYHTPSADASAGTTSGVLGRQGELSGTNGASQLTSWRGAIILASGAALGLLSDGLFGVGALGANWGLWITALVVAVTVQVRSDGVIVSGASRLFLAGAVVFACFLAWRDSPFLAALNMGLTLFCLAMAAAFSKSGRFVSAGIMSYVWAMMRTLGNATGGCCVLIFREVRWAEVARVTLTSRARAVLRGAFLSVPLLVVFGFLFVSADAKFEGVVTGLLAWIPIVSPYRIFWILAVAWIVAGYLRYAVLGRSANHVVALQPGSLTLGATEAAVALISLNVLFAGFVAVQVPYLFGGIRHVAETSGLTLAQYARRGFFELAIVAILALPMLLLADWLLDKSHAGAVRAVRMLSGVFIALLFVIMYSAANRMRLYTYYYGLTELRFYVLSFILLLAFVFAWFAMTVLRGKREVFLAGALALGFAGAVVVQSVNPDRMIARSNLALARAGKPIDVPYLLFLKLRLLAGDYGSGIWSVCR